MSPPPTHTHAVCQEFREAETGSMQGRLGAALINRTKLTSVHIPLETPGEFHLREVSI